MSVQGRDLLSVRNELSSTRSAAVRMITTLVRGLAPDRETVLLLAEGLEAEAETSNNAAEALLARRAAASLRRG
ncbi:hypothetical protein [Falsirhodobacter xinxiangensis]|uniref:hypothetical protein n=1 Tax=Falsirhodobacter xinxiangensis TaxID=2530049 RepID=UPI0010A996D9|nr:hypothetical protein [Rhodobacter xinxiangensis]MDH2326824.1 hypothetical protein [Cereibacter flavus]